MGSVSIDVTLSNIWKSWYLFNKGKKRTPEFEEFSYYLERNLAALHQNLQNGTYRHGKYRSFTVSDSKRRTISVASIRDRIVHRLLYEYLCSLYDQTFIFDAWSCRKNKGLIGAIERTQKFLRSYPASWIWRADVKKFFDSVDHGVLLKILSKRVKEPGALFLLKDVVMGYSLTRQPKRESKTASPKGIPIGNLTSQIFANIYLNELDRFIMHAIKPLGYVRYGDDCIIIGKTRAEITAWRERTMKFLGATLSLEINSKNDIIVKARYGLHFLGTDIFINGRRLRRRTLGRIRVCTNLKNAASYYGLLNQHGNAKIKKYYNWLLLNTIVL